MTPEEIGNLLAREGQERVNLTHKQALWVAREVAAAIDKALDDQLGLIGSELSDALANGLDWNGAYSSAVDAAIQARKG